MEIKVTIPALEKLVDYTASGIGSVAGTMLLPWRADQEAKARLISAKGERDAQSLLAEGQADTMGIIADAQTKAREIIVSPDSEVRGELNFAGMISQRIQFQEEKRQRNIGSVVLQAASQLEDKHVDDHDLDHDWTARFFSDIQDVSNEEMQLLYAKILAGEVEGPGSTSIRTLSILKNLDQQAASLFRILCSLAIFSFFDEQHMSADRVVSLGGDASQNALKGYGLSFNELNVLNEHGLIISDYNSWRDLRMSVSVFDTSEIQDNKLVYIPFRFQNRYWLLKPNRPRKVDAEYRVHGVALTNAGRELSTIIEWQLIPEYQSSLVKFFASQGMVMTEVDNALPRVVG